jgi:hypothetical protein
MLNNVCYISVILQSDCLKYTLVFVFIAAVWIHLQDMLCSNKDNMYIIGGQTFGLGDLL